MGSICSAEAKASSSSDACIPDCHVPEAAALDASCWTREAANLLWSSAQLGLNPDALVPGMTDSLARQFMVDMDAATGQGFANVLAACAKLQLSPCQGGLVKAICRRLAAVDMSTFGSQAVANTLHSLATLPAATPSIDMPGMTDILARQFMVDMDTATGQGFASVLVACAKLQLSPCQGGLVKAICGRLAAVDMSTFGSQTVANTLHSLATISAAAPSADVLDALSSGSSFHCGTNSSRNRCEVLAVLARTCPLNSLGTCR